MNERAARDVMLARAIEMTDDAREIWSDADRMWAGRTAAETVGESAEDDAFLAQRAALVLERIGKRHPKVTTLARAPPVRGYLTPVAIAAAFVIGAAGADIGPAHRVNLLAPPVLALLAWNLAVYGALLAGAVMLRGRWRAGDGPVRRTVVAWLRDIARPLRAAAVPRPLAAALTRFAADWSALAAPLWRDRAVRLLHLCAAALAAGAIAGLYLRGIALEYRAAWQSTFLDATDVARLLRVVLAPGSWLTGIPIPGSVHLQTIAGGSDGENAAPWIHLYGATLLLIVIVPRLALAVIAWLSERRMTRAFPVGTGQPYFRRLLHAWRQGTARIAVIPYSYDVPRGNAEGLARLLTRVFQSAVDITWLPAVAYGGDDLPEWAAVPLAAVIAVFNLNATAEGENQGAFVRALLAKLEGSAPLALIVDTSDFASRFRDNPRRIAEREAAWQQLLAEYGTEAVFVRLAEPDLPAAAAAMTRRVEA